MNKINNLNLRAKVNTGFTLIELLIVMAIIAVLSGLSLFSLQSARKQGRDGKRKSDLEVIRSGLELYKADCNAYPAAPLPTPGGKLTSPASCTGAVNTYIQTIPGDPSSNVSYPYTVTGSTYSLCSNLEDSTNTTSGCGTCNPSPCRYKTTNP